MTLVIEQNNSRTQFSVIRRFSEAASNDSDSGINKSTPPQPSIQSNVNSIDIITNSKDFSGLELASYAENVDVNSSLSSVSSLINSLISDITITDFPLTNSTNQEFILTPGFSSGASFDTRLNFDVSLNTFETASIEKLIKSSQKSIGKISILSHEKLFVLKSGNTIDTNLLYLSSSDIDREKFKSINTSKYSKFESISDRFFSHINIENYDKMLKSSLIEAEKHIIILDDISTFAKKLEKDINYGNIVENFIKEGTTKYNSRILGLLTENDDVYIDSVARSDERLLVKQDKFLSTNISAKSRNNYYNNVLGFSLIEENPNFTNSIKNSIIKNTDTVVGQIMVMQGLSLFSLHPNDNVFSRAYLNSRSKINLNAFNKFPILQLTDFNSNVFEKNQEILSIQNDIFSTTIKYKNDFLFPISTLDNNVGNYIDKRINDNITFQTKNSLLGFVAKENQGGGGEVLPGSTVFEPGSIDGTFTDFPEKINNKQIRLMLSNGSPDGESAFDLLITDAYSYHPDASPTFLTLPTRYFSSSFFSIINTQLSDEEARSRGEQTISRSYDDNFNDFLSFGNANSIKSSIERRLFKNFNFPGNEGNAPITVQEQRVRDKIKKIYQEQLGSQLQIIYENSILDNQEHSNCDDKIKLIYSFSGESDVERNFHTATLDEFIMNSNSDLPFAGASSFDSYTQLLQDNYDLENSSVPNEGVIASNISQSLQTFDLNNRLNDIVLFNTSNSFLNKKELEDYSYEYKREGLLSEKKSLKYVKYNYEKTNNERGKNLLKKHSSYASVLYNKNSFTHASKILENIATAISTTRFTLGGSVIEKYASFIKKAKSKVVDGNKYILLYDKDKVNSLENFDESSFISENKFYKNNFVDSFSSIKNTSEAFFEEDNFEDHLMTSEEYRNFLSKVYTKSFLRSKKSLIKKILKDNTRIFKQFSYEDRRYFGFDKLLSDVFLSEKAKPAIKRKVTNMIAVCSILNTRKINSELGSLKNKPSLIDMKDKDSRADENFMFSKEFKKVFSKEFVDEVVRGIFDPYIIKEQRNFVIRSLQSKINQISKLNFSGSEGIGGVKYVNTPGLLLTLKFPFKSKKHTMPNSFFLRSISDLTDDSRTTILKTNMNKLSNYIAYNHDIFIDEKETGISYYENITIEDDLITEEDETSSIFYGCAGYDFIGNKTTYGTDLKITYYDYKSPSSNSIKAPYDQDKVVIPFSYFYNSCINNTLSYFMTNLSKNIFEIFECDLSGINTIQDAFDFLELNKHFVKIIQNILECYAYVFSTSYDNLTNNMVYDICNNALNNDQYSGESSFENFLEKSVSDIEIVLNKMLSSFEYKPESVYNENDFLQNYENDMFTSRSIILQKVCSTLLNSDISESIGHDLVHGFFLNYEDNKNNKEDNLKSYNDSVEKIRSDVSLLDIDKNIINNFILDEAYQNKVSKNIQEVIYYKNLYKETFVNNTMYLNLKEKYETNNKFNHRKVHEDAEYKHAIKCLEQITSSLPENRKNNLDIVKIPITFDLAKKITTRGILKVTILPVNVKYPEVEYQELNYFYSPMLANVTSQYADIVDDTSNFIGIYNDTQKISERYCVVDKDTAISEINFALTDIFNLKQEITQQNSLPRTRLLSNIIVNQNKLSHNIQQLGYISQSAVSVNTLAFDKDINNVISPEASQLFQDISEESLKKSFNLESIDLTSILTGEGYQDLGSNKSILKNQHLYKKFMLNIDRDISKVDLLKTLLPTKNYDIFNILINKNDVVPLEISDITDYRDVARVLAQGRNNVLQPVEIDSTESIETFNATKSFLFYIKIGVL